MVEQGFEAVEDKNFVVGKTDNMLFPSSTAEEFRANDMAILQSKSGSNC